MRYKHCLNLSKNNYFNYHFAQLFFLHYSVTMSGKTPEPEQIDRELAVVNLRRTGLTWEMIAREVGYASPAGAWKAYERACARTLEEPTAEARRIELDRLDALQYTYWDPAIAGNLRAADFVLKVIDRRAKILGIDAPQKIQAEVVTYDGTGSLDAEVERIARIIDAAERQQTTDSADIEQHSEGITVLVEEQPGENGTTTA
jgi:hypothetical protein